MSESETDQTNTEVTQAIFKSSAPPILVGGDGNILPCVELCNINYNFQTQDKFTVSNQNGRLFVQTDEGLSSKSTMFPCYTSVDICSAANTPSDKLYTLEDIIITCPSLHRLYVDGKVTIFDGEIYIVFKNTYEGSTTYKVLSILLTQTSTMSTATANNCLNAYKLFESLANDLPDKDSENTVSTIADWDINDLLPANKWFYNYTHPNNINVNWYVFKNPLYIPNLFKTNFISSVSQVTSNGSIETGTTAYNTLYSTITNLQNPVTTDNSFVIFEQRDLTALAGGSGTATPVVQTVSVTKNISTSVYDNGEEESNDLESSTKSSADNYETGDISDEDEKEEIEEQVYEENKTWAITVLIINLIYFVGAIILIILVAKGNEALKKILGEGGRYNFIFYYLILFIPFIIITSIYLSFGLGSSDITTTNKVFITLNYIGYIILFVFSIIKLYQSTSKSLEKKETPRSIELPPAINQKPLTKENIAKDLLKKTGGKRKIRNRK